MQPFRIAFILTTGLFAAVPAVSAQASPRDPCTLLTAPEVSAALGITSRPGQPFHGSRVVCYFAADTNLNVGSPSVTVMAMTITQFQGQSHLGGTLAAHPIGGLGDEAFYVGGAGPYTKVCVRKGDRALSITIIPGHGSAVTPANVLEKEKGLAQRAVARL